MTAKHLEKLAFLEKLRTAPEAEDLRNDQKIGSLLLYIPEAVEDWINEYEHEHVVTYLKKKLEESGNRIVKVGVTKLWYNTGNDTIYGNFHWSLRGTFYQQLAVFNEETARWELTPHH